MGWGGMGCGGSGSLFGVLHVRIPQTRRCYCGCCRRCCCRLGSRKHIAAQKGLVFDCLLACLPACLSVLCVLFACLFVCLLACLFVCLLALLCGLLACFLVCLGWRPVPVSARAGPAGPRARGLVAEWTTLGGQYGRARTTIANQIPRTDQSNV